MTTPVAARACARRAPPAAQNTRSRFIERMPADTCGTSVAHAAAVIAEKLAMTNDRHITRTRFHISDAVRASISDDGLVLLDLRGGLMLASNAIGARIWHLLESQLDCLEIANRLAQDYGLSIEAAQHDVAAFLAALEARGLVSAERAC